MKKEAEPFAEEAKLEMGELVDSEPELYEGDNEGYKPKKSRKDNQFKNVPGNHDLNSQVDPMREDYLFDQLYDSDSDRSLVDAEEHEDIVKAHKKRDVKLNNSFTGPYPQDPTDFNHNDKGANAQFVYYNKLIASK